MAGELGKRKGFFGRTWDKTKKATTNVGKGIAETATSGYHNVARWGESTNNTMGTRLRPLKQSEERKKMYVHSEKFLLEAIARRGLDNCYQITEADKTAAVEVVNKSRRDHGFAREKDDTDANSMFERFAGHAVDGVSDGVGKVDDIGGIGAGLNEVLLATKKNAKGSKIGNAVSSWAGTGTNVVQIGTSIAELKTGGASWMGALNVVGQFGKTAVKATEASFLTAYACKDTVGLQQAAVGIGMALSAVDLAENVGKTLVAGHTGAAAALMKASMSRAAAPYDLTNPADAIIALEKARKTEVETLENLKNNIQLGDGAEKQITYEQAKSAFEDAQNAYDDGVLANKDKTELDKLEVAKKNAEADKNITYEQSNDKRLKIAEENIKAATNALTSYTKSLPAIRRLTTVQLNAGVDMASSVAGALVDSANIAAGICELSGAGAGVGFGIALGSMAVQAATQLGTHAAKKGIRKRAVKEEMKGRRNLQQAALGVTNDEKKSAKAAGANASGRDKEVKDLIEGGHKGRHANKMMDLAKIDQIVQDIIDNVYTRLNDETKADNSKGDYAEKKLAVTGGHKMHHGTKTTRAFKRVILYEMGITSGKRKDLSGVIAANRTIAVLRDAGVQRANVDETYKKRADERKKGKVKTQYEDNMEPAVRELENIHAKIRPDILSQDLVWALPDTDKIAEKYGASNKNIGNYVKTTQTNPFLLKWEQDTNKTSAGVQFNAQNADTEAQTLRQSAIDEVNKNEIYKKQRTAGKLAGKLATEREELTNLTDQAGKEDTAWA